MNLQDRIAALEKRLDEVASFVGFGTHEIADDGQRFVDEHPLSVNSAAPVAKAKMDHYVIVSQSEGDEDDLLYCGMRGITSCWTSHVKRAAKFATQSQALAVIRTAQPKTGYGPPYVVGMPTVVV